MRPNCSSHDSSERPCFQNLLLESCYYLFVSLIWFSMIILLHFRAFEPTPPSVSRMAPESFFFPAFFFFASVFSPALPWLAGLPAFGSCVSSHSPEFRLYVVYALGPLPFLAFASLQRFCRPHLFPSFDEIHTQVSVPRQLAAGLAGWLKRPQVTLPNSAYTLYKLSVLCLFLAFASPLSQLWWAQVESNHRPHAYQACALTF